MGKSSLVSLTTVCDLQNGDLTFIEIPDDVGFEVKRIFYIWGNEKENVQRGGHKHKVCKQLLIPLRGNFVIKADDTEYKLHYPDIGLFVDAGTMVEYTIVEADSILLVLASEHYDPEDYIYEYSVS